MKKLAFFLLIFSTQLLLAQTDEARKKIFNLKKNVAIEGYDPLGYFDGKPAEGNPTWTYSHHGVTYQFSSAAHLDRFKANPEKYEPAYGGWCAYAMGATGEKVKVDPDTYKIIEGRLYLFYNFWGNNTLVDWNKNEHPLKTKADQHWERLVNAK